MLIRLFRSEAMWELEAADLLYRAEFRLHDGRPDLELSVYEASSEELCRIVAEHMASSNADPNPRADGHPNVSALVEEVRPLVEPAPESAWFQLINDRHRILRFRDAHQLVDFVGRLHETRHSVRIEAARKAVKAYVKERLDRGDSEWERFCSSHAKGAKWRSLQARPVQGSE